jgi:hypothetical protein
MARLTAEFAGALAAALRMVCSAATLLTAAAVVVVDDGSTDDDDDEADISIEGNTARELLDDDDDEREEPAICAVTTNVELDEEGAAVVLLETGLAFAEVDAAEAAVPDDAADVDDDDGAWSAGVGFRPDRTKMPMKQINTAHANKLPFSADVSSNSLKYTEPQIMSQSKKKH